MIDYLFLMKNQISSFSEEGVALVEKRLSDKYAYLRKCINSECKKRPSRFMRCVNLGKEKK